MKKQLAVAVAISVSLGVSSFAPIVEQPTRVEAADFQYTQEQQQTLQYLNNVRQKAGLQLVKLNPFLNKAAENHTNYLFINGINFEADAHQETKGDEGYTGKTSAERVKAVGGDSEDVSEVLTLGLYSVQQSMYELIDQAPYHRVKLLSAGLKEIGVGSKGGIFVINTKSEWGATQDVTYPYNGQTNVDVRYSGQEDPDPLATNGMKKSGFILSYSVPDGTFIEDIKITLKDSKGNIVPVVKEVGPIDSYFLPKEDLKFSEKYTATVSYQDMYTGEKGGKTWSFTTKAGSTGTQPSTPAPKVVYADFQTGQYWSTNMLWAIDKGLISGYINVKNIKTGKYENLLKPNDKLTEAQFLSVMFRYTSPTELANTKPKDSKYWASTAYQLAEKYKLPTNATLTNRENASKPITRGKMAQLLVSKHQGKTISEKVAVEFFIKNKISSQTDYNNFMAKDTLTRAHIVTFMKNYDTQLGTQNK